jgi:hypothetical protein
MANAVELSRAFAKYAQTLEPVARAQLAYDVVHGADLEKLYPEVFDSLSRISKEFNPDQPRDEHGKWTSGGDSGSMQKMPYPMRVGDNASHFQAGEAEIAQTAFKNVSLDHIAIRMSSNALWKITQDGRMKSVFETGTNFAGDRLGASYMSERNNLETNLWKVPADATRPIYGYLDTQYNNHDPMVSQYGDIKVTLNDNVAGRTTMTADDSLNAYTIPVPIMDARAGTLSDQAISNATPRFSVDRGNLDVHYYEAQIHGGVSLSDIKSVDLGGKLIAPDTFDALVATGIEVKNENSYQNPFDK